jgi:peptidoglycan hydrolase CwlO-like protein
LKTQKADLRRELDLLDKKIGELFIQNDRYVKDISRLTEEKELLFEEIQNLESLLDARELEFNQKERRLSLY